MLIDSQNKSPACTKDKKRKAESPQNSQGQIDCYLPKDGQGSITSTKTIHDDLLSFKEDLNKLIDNCLEKFTTECKLTKTV